MYHTSNVALLLSDLYVLVTTQTTKTNKSLEQLLFWTTHSSSIKGSHSDCCLTFGDALKDMEEHGYELQSSTTHLSKSDSGYFGANGNLTVFRNDKFKHFLSLSHHCSPDDSTVEPTQSWVPHVDGCGGRIIHGSSSEVYDILGQFQGWQYTSPLAWQLECPIGQ